MIHIIRIATRVLTSNPFLISCGSSLDFWLVDVGDFEKVLYQLPKKAKIQGVFLTHTHFDHIYGINEMNKVFPNCRVFVSKYGEEALFSAKKNFSYYYESPIIYGGQNIQVLCEGDSVELYPSVNMKVYETPGHCPSCLSYEVENNFFSGDSFIPGEKVVSKLPLGDKAKAQLSLHRILSLSEGMKVYPGHGQIVQR